MKFFGPKRKKLLAHNITSQVIEDYLILCKLVFLSVIFGRGSDETGTRHYYE